MNRVLVLSALAAIATLLIVITVPLVVTKNQADDQAADDLKAMSAAAAAAAAEAAAGAGPRQVKYIAAEEVQWNYAPTGDNQCGTFNATAPFWFSQKGAGTVFKKVQYVEYTDASYKTRVPREAGMDHLGLLGPLIRVTPGERLTVYFKNNAAFAAGIQPGGLLPLARLLPGAADGARQTNWDAARALPFASGVAPGGEAVYEWIVPPEAGPAADEPDTKLWLYRSALYPDGSDNAGLVGPILVSRAGSPPGGAAPAGRDIVTVMENLNEGASPLREANLAGRDAAALGLADEAELDANLVMHAVNGYIFCGLPGLEMTQGESVRWHLAGVGSEGDMHSAHWHGNTMTLQGHRADQVKLVPGAQHSVAFEPRSPGTWLFHCHVSGHLNAGMTALYIVLPAAGTGPPPRDAQPAPGGMLREHFIAAEEVVHNYCPLSGNACPAGGAAAAAAVAVAPFTDAELATTGNATGRLGCTYLKASFVEYTDASFTTRVARPAEDAYMGTLGPTLRAEVGDALRVTLLNRLRYPATLHPHGVRYSKRSEGAPYADGTSGEDRADDGVPPGGRHVYEWGVPESAGPGPADPPTVVWMYHSHSDESKDTMAGLVGAILVGKRGAFRRAPGGGLGASADVDADRVLFFAIVNERSSLFWEDNAAVLAQRDAGAPAGAPAAEGDEAAAAADQMHSVNFAVYCNGPPVGVTRGQTVRYHVLSLGTDVDMHAPSLEAAAWAADGRRAGSLAMMPGVMQSADVAVTAPAGLGVLECRVAAHVAAGMRALVRVAEPADADGAPAPGGAAAADLAAAAAAAAALPALSAGGGSPAPEGAQSVRAAGAGATRRHFIAAQQVQWDYAPLAANNCSVGGATPFTAAEALFTDPSNATIGRVYTKAVYRGYTAADFATEVPAPAHHGLLGPLVAANVGDVLEVVFLNNLTFAANLRFDGGLVALPGGADPGAAVAPGARATYRLFVPSSAGPTPTDLSTVTFAYRSSVAPEAHAVAGLAGVLLVGRPGAFGPEPAAGPPAGVDAVLPLLVAVLDEAASPYLGANMAAAGLAGLDPADPDFAESNLKHALNGFLFCNGPDAEVAAGAVVRVAAVALGSQADLHSMQFMGQNLRGPDGAAQSAVAPMLPGAGLTADLVPAEPGRWNFACAVHDHIEAGMQGALAVV